MGQISSIHLKPSKAFNVWHNADIRPSYAIDSSGNGLWFNRSGLEAQRLKEQIIARAKENYQTHCKARNKAFQAKSYEWSAVVNLKPDSTQEDLERLAQHFSDKYGFQCYQIAIHRDEGHIDNGQKIINHHAHLEFITLDKETGKNNFRGSLRTPKALSQMQSEVAEILQMERGIDKRLSGAKRIEPRAYAAMKEAEKAQNRELNEKIGNKLDEAREHIENQNAQITGFKVQITNLENQIEIKDNEIATLKQIKAEFETKRKEWIAEKDKIKADYDALSALRKDCLDKRNLTLEQVREFIENLEQERDKERELRESAERERNNLRSELDKNAQQESAASLINKLNSTWQTFFRADNGENPKYVDDFIQYFNEQISPKFSQYDGLFNYCSDLEKALQNQNELSTNAQNDDSNTKLFKNH